MIKIAQLICDKKFKVLSGDKKYIQILKIHLKKKSTDQKIEKGNTEYITKLLVHDEKYIFTVIDVNIIKKLEKEAWIDSLTGVFNRNAYWEMLPKVIEECERDNHNLGVIFVDIDNLKSINKTKGYIGGDNAISGVAKIVHDTIRKTDDVFRMGGDEFLVLAPFINIKTSKQAFISLVKRMNKSIKRSSKKYSTASLGGLLINTKVVKTLYNSSKFNKDWSKIVQKVDSLTKNAKEKGKSTYDISFM